MLLSPSLKRTGFTVAVVFVLAGFVAAQTIRHRKRAKRSKTLVTCSHHTSQGMLCGPPVTLVTNADAVPKNTVTVQVIIDETGNVVSARAVAGNPTYYETAVANGLEVAGSPRYPEHQRPSRWMGVGLPSTYRNSISPPRSSSLCSLEP